jgi:2-C-methyl-D-erythritol 4-phosphate cytidylyltransferase
MAVHDAARPLAAGWLLQAGIDAVRDSPGAVPALPLHDTLKRVDAAGKVVETVDRATLRAVQTPQVFVASALRQAHEQAARSGTTMTDDAGLLERAGLAVSVFPGSPANLKITTARDLELAHLLLRAGLAS